MHGWQNVLCEVDIESAVPSFTFRFLIKSSKPMHRIHHRLSWYSVKATPRTHFCHVQPLITQRLLTTSRASMAQAEKMGGSEAPWHAKYPAPNYVPFEISREDALAMLKDPSQVAGRDYVLVDVRRNDFEGGTIRGSVNFPAQSLYPTRPAIFQMVKAAGIKRVIFYCGSCNGRGPRAAAMFGDYLEEQQFDGARSMILTGGIKGWAKAGKEYVDLMDEYDASVWSQT